MLEDIRCKRYRKWSLYDKKWKNRRQKIEDTRQMIKDRRQKMEGREKIEDGRYTKDESSEIEDNRQIVENRRAVVDLLDKEHSFPNENSFFYFVFCLCGVGDVLSVVPLWPHSSRCRFAASEWKITKRRRTAKTW